MISPVATIGTILMGICFLLHVIGIATDYWFVVGQSTYHAGLFRSCSEEGCNYFAALAALFLNVHYIGSVICCCLCCLLLFIATLVGLCGFRSQYPKSAITKTGSVGLSGAILGTGGFIWYYLSSFGGAVYGISIFDKIAIGNPGYSFYLCASASGIALVLAIILIIVGCIMAPNEGVILSQQPGLQMVAIQNQQQQQQPYTLTPLQQPYIDLPEPQHQKQPYSPGKKQLQPHRSEPELQPYRSGPELQPYRSGPEQLQPYRSGPEQLQPYRPEPEQLQPYRSGPELQPYRSGHRFQAR